MENAASSGIIAGMDQLLTTVPAHFDGHAIVLDATVTLKPNARLLVTFLDPDAGDIVYDMMAASAASLAQLWDNDEDAVYDAY